MRTTPKKKSWKPLLKRGFGRASWEKELKAEIKEHSFCRWMFWFCLQESDGTLCPPSLSTSTFCKLKSGQEKITTNELLQGSVKKKKKKEEGLRYFGRMWCFLGLDEVGLGIFYMSGTDVMFNLTRKGRLLQGKCRQSMWYTAWFWCDIHQDEIIQLIQDSV